jgi:predicted ATPase
MLDVRQDGSRAFLEARSRAREPGVDLAQAGQGLSQVLPVVVQAVTAREAGPGVDIVEHPEAELHPGAHAAVADLLLDKLPGPQRPVVVETHSEVLLLRIRRKIAEGSLAPNDVAIYWIDSDTDGQATARRVKVTEKGEVENWPEGVFLEDYEEILGIRRAARERKA